MKTIVFDFLFSVHIVPHMTALNMLRSDAEVWGFDPHFC